MNKSSGAGYKVKREMGANPMRSRHCEGEQPRNATDLIGKA